MQKKIHKRTKNRFFHYFAIVTKLISKENKQSDLAVIFWHDKILGWAYNLLRDATEISKKEIDNQELAINFSNRSLKIKYLRRLKCMTQNLKSIKRKYYIKMFYRLKSTTIEKLKVSMDRWVDNVEKSRLVESDIQQKNYFSRLNLVFRAWKFYSEDKSLRCT